VSTLPFFHGLPPNLKPRTIRPETIPPGRLHARPSFSIPRSFPAFRPLFVWPRKQKEARFFYSRSPSEKSFPSSPGNLSMSPRLPSALFYPPWRTRLRLPLDPQREYPRVLSWSLGEEQLHILFRGSNGHPSSLPCTTKPQSRPLRSDLSPLAVAKPDGSGTFSFI